MPGLMILGVDQRRSTAPCRRWPRRDFKYMIGYSSVSHMGYVLMGLATLNDIGVNGAVLQMFSHGVMTALMFAMVGAVYDQAHTREMAVFGGPREEDAASFVVFFGDRRAVVAGLAGACGLRRRVPHLRRDVPGRLLRWPARSASSPRRSRRSTSCACWRMAFFGPFNEKWEGLKDMTRSGERAAVCCIVFILFMGLWPAPFVDRISPRACRASAGDDVMNDLNFDYTAGHPEYILVAGRAGSSCSTCSGRRWRSGDCSV